MIPIGITNYFNRVITPLKMYITNLNEIKTADRLFTVFI